jgi:hypothetical protein
MVSISFSSSYHSCWYRVTVLSRLVDAKGHQSVQEVCAGLSQGWVRDTLWHLTLTFLVCQRSPKRVWSQWPPERSLSVSWCGEAFHGLEVQGAEVSTLLCASPLPSVSPASQQGLWFMELALSASVFHSLFWISSVSNISHMNSPPLPFSFITLLLHSWSSFNRCHFCIYIHVHTLFCTNSPSYPFSQHLHLPLVQIFPPGQD